MKFFLLIIFLLGISRDIFGKGIRRKKSNNEVELSYQDLKNLNISCYPYDSCKQVRSDDGPVPAPEAKCSCHSQCWEYGTCCIDSPYRVKLPIQKCMFEGGKNYYMVHRCPDNSHPDSIWRNHCEREVSDTDDILMISPVTSLDTSRTYRNYYCFRCHETTDKYVPWNLEMSSSDDALRRASVYSVAYNQTVHSWVAILDGSHDSLPVSLSFVFPQNVQGKPVECGSLKVIAECPSWTDKHDHAKCLAYSAVVYNKFSKFKNVHCALCNNAPLDSLSCNLNKFGGGSSSGYVPYAFVGGSDRRFRNTMDVSDGGKDGTCVKNDDKPEPCKGDYNVCNPYSKNCVEAKCLCPEFVVKNGLCVKP